MASSVPNPDTPPNLSASGHVASKFDSIPEASHVSYQEGQLTWDGGKLGDEDIITITNINGQENKRVIWSLARVDTVADLEQPPFELQSTSTTSLPPDILEEYLSQAPPDHLNAETHDICVLISTRSGTGLAPDFFKQVLHPLLSAVGLANTRYRVLETETAESVKEFAQSTLLDNANNGRKQTVLLLSGDGGIVDTLNGLLETERQTRYFFFAVDFIVLPTNCHLQYLCETNNRLTSTRYRKRSFPLSPPPFYDPVNICSRATNFVPWETSFSPCLLRVLLSRCTFPLQ
jgi:hypothetical protein